MQDVVLEVQGLSKTFKIREHKINSIRSYLSALASPNSNIKLVKALNDVSFEVKRGEFIGVIGRNGSGKSTLLKLLMGSYMPDKGSKIHINGSIMRLALGMGFDANLSARDNIYINGSIIGMTFKEIGEKFNEIVEFAEIKEFVDTPIKFYSSGMKSKLTFSIAINASAEILLIDEFFGGVGDISFRAKSEKVFKESFITGRTIIFVSHNLTLIQEFSNRVFYIDQGNLHIYNNPAEAINQYEKTYK